MSGDFFSGVGDALSGGANALGQLFGPSGFGGAIGSNLGGLMGSGSNPVSTADATTTALDPTGAEGAQASIAAGQPAPTQTQTQNPQGQTQSPVEQLTRALKAAQQQRRQQPPQGNPYQTGGPSPPPSPQIAQGRPAPPAANAINRQDAIDAGLYAPNISPSDAVNAGLLDPGLIDPNTGAISDQARTPPDPRAGPAGEAAVRDALAPQARPEATFTPPPEAPTPPTGGPSLGGLAQSILPDMLAAPGAAAGLYFGPLMGTADTGELRPGQPGYGESYPKGTDPGSYPESTDYPQAQPGKPQLPSDKGQTPTKKQYEEWLKKMGVDPKKAKKAADDAPLPTKKGGPPPTKVPPPVGTGNIMRDISGGQGVPQMLGQLAQMALPIMLMLGASGAFGGFGGRGRHGFGGWRGGRHGDFDRFRGGFGGRPGGFSGHHGFGGRPGFGERPGFGGFRPIGAHHGFGERGFGPRDVIPGRRSSWLGYNQQPASLTGNPQLDQLLLSLGAGGQNQNQQGGGAFGMGGGGGGGGQGGGGGGGGGEGPAPTNGPWSINPFLSNIVGSESGGDNNAVGDGGQAHGVYQFHTPTWRTYAAKAGVDINKYPSAEMAPPEVQQQVALTVPFNQWGPNTRAAAHRQFGNFNENLTMGQLADQFGGAEWASRDRTKTGGSQEPNPDGNLATPSPPNVKDPSEWPNNIAAQ